MMPNKEAFNNLNYIRLKCRSLLLAILLLNAASQGFGQDVHNDWLQLLGQYQNGNLNDTAYLNRAIDLAGKSFKDPQFKENLRLYKRIAWNNDSYHNYRVKYYSLLVNNATFTHKDGAAIYYLQKSESELEKRKPYTNSLNEPRLLLTIYGRKEDENYDKRIEVFEKVLPYLKNMPKFILDQNIPPVTCLNAMSILNLAGRLYANMHNTSMVYEIVDISDKLWNSIKQKNNLPKDRMNQILYLIYQVRYSKALVNGDFSLAKDILDTNYAIIHSDKDINIIWKRSAERALLRKYLDYYIMLRQTDSSSHYLQLLSEKINRTDPGDGLDYLLYTAKVNALDGDFKKAYYNLLFAYKTSDSLINLKTTDINNNLYAQLTSEQRREEVVQLQSQKQKRNIIIVIALIVGIFCIIYLYVQMHRKEKMAQKNVDELNMLAQRKIAELEFKANLLQRKLGMELHDDIASRLVYLCNLIEKEALDEPDSRHAKILHTISDLARDTYQRIRNKSHEWYFEGMKEEQQSFLETIFKLADYALPDEHYNKIIEIDEASLPNISNTIRIELIRIIQEAYVNILKHAGANSMQLYIYEEDNIIHLQINDNGKGFNPDLPSKGRGIGLQSLRNTVMKMNGTLNITSSKTGTELIIAIPV